MINYYTKEDLIFLIKHLAQGFPMSAIAEKLHRKESAMRVMLCSRNLRVSEIKKKARAGWTAEEILDASDYNKSKKVDSLRHKLDLAV